MGHTANACCKRSGQLLALMKGRLLQIMRPAHASLTFNCLIPSPFGIHARDDDKLKLPCPVFFVEEVDNPLRPGGIADGATNFVAQGKKLFCGMRTDVAIHTGDKDGGALGEGEVGHID